MSDIPEYDGRDFFLMELVKRANDYGPTGFVALNVGGLVISGQLVGASDYFDELARNADQEASRGDKTSSAMADNCRIMSKTYAKRREQIIRGIEPEDVSAPHMIHLKNTRIHWPTGELVPSDAGIWWRGKIESVDGFCVMKP
jgi:hypothetical protein